MSSLDSDLEIKILQNCHDEELRFYHQVQKFSYFVAFDKESYQVTAISDNLLDYLQLDRLEVFNQKIQSLLSKKTCDDLLLTIKEYDDGSETNLLPLSFKNQKKVFDCIVFHENGDIYLEIEKFNISKSLSRHLFFDMFHNSKGAIEDENDVYSIADSLCHDLKAALGIDRVMIYRFDDTDNGEVIGEAREQSLEPFLGLYYPASDIPKQARDLYLKNRSRIIYDVYEDSVKIITQNNKQINLARSSCRTVSPVHIQYLKNMKVRSSFSISLIHNERLWGLICCHHSSPFFLPYRTRLLLESMGSIMMARIGQYESKIIKEAEQQASNLTLRIIQDLTSFEDKSINSSYDDNIIANVFHNQKERILDLLDATGFYLKLDELEISMGEKVPKIVIKKLSELLKTDNKEMIYTQNIYDDFPDLDSTDTLGVLALNFSSLGEENTIVWIRPELEKQIRWAGKDEKEEVTEGNVTRLLPRKSFEEFTQTIKGKARAFSDKDLVSARQFYILINKIILTLWKQSQFRMRKMIELDKAKDSFIGLVSHELRTPLNNMLGWIQIMEGQGQNKDIMQEGLEVLKLNATNQMTVVSDLIDFSRMQSGKLNVELFPLNIVSLIDEVLKSIKPTASTKEISFDFKHSSEKLIMSGDKERLSQVIWNLLHNAIKFSPKKAIITIEVEKENSDLKLTISDEGVGIEKKDLGSIFNRFHQLDSGLNRKHNGLGLGLSMVKVLTELHGGSVEALSEGKDKGTSFILSFPIASFESEEAIHFEKTQKQTKVLDGIKILLLEDNIDSARFIKLAVEQSGASIQIFDHARKAIERLKLGEDYDLIISDVGLPDINGHEFIQIVRNDLKNSLYAIALTAHVQKSDIDLALSSGFNSHVEKPVNLEILINEITKATYGNN